jgi:hypothetical protein
MACVCEVCACIDNRAAGCFPFFGEKEIENVMKLLEKLQ